MKRYSFPLPLLTPARTLLRGLLPVLLLALISRSAQAQAPFPVTVESADAQSVRVRITNTAAGRVRVLSLSTGQLLFDEAYLGPGYGHRFNFSQLTPGRYALLVDAGPTHHRYTLLVQPGAAGARVALRTIRTRLPKLALAAAQL